MESISSYEYKSNIYPESRVSNKSKTKRTFSSFLGTGANLLDGRKIKNSSNQEIDFLEHNSNENFNTNGISVNCMYNRNNVIIDQPGNSLYYNHQNQTDFFRVNQYEKINEEIGLKNTYFSNSETIDIKYPMDEEQNTSYNNKQLNHRFHATSCYNDEKNSFYKQYNQISSLGIGGNFQFKLNQIQRMHLLKLKISKEKTSYLKDTKGIENGYLIEECCSSN